MAVFAFSACSKAVIEENNPTPEPVNRTIYYTPDVASIMTNSCITCHAGPAADAGLDLTSFESVRFSAQQGNLIQRMNNSSSPMPPQGLLSAEVRQIIDKWRADGYLINSN